MSYTIQLDATLETTLQKLKKKDSSLYKRVVHKIIEVSENPEMGKPLRNVLRSRWRVHIGSFVLVYTVSQDNKMVIFIAFEHHDKIYR